MYNRILTGFAYTRVIIYVETWQFILILGVEEEKSFCLVSILVKYEVATKILNYNPPTPSVWGSETKEGVCVK